MPVVAVDLLFVVLILAMGFALGWWLRSRGPQARQVQPADEVKQAREVLGRLRDLATRVASDVGAHTHRVEAINSQLNAATGTEHEAVVQAVAQLIEANTRMQGQLGSAEERLKEQAELVEQHAKAARTDALTGLANRRAFDEEMQSCMERYRKLGETFSTVIFDVDHFKKFNDTYGHQAGDDVLRLMGELLRAAARKGDFVARYGGEEFAMILPHTPVIEAKLSADRVRRRIADHGFRCDEQELRVTASLGVAQVFQGETVSHLIDRADAALYAAKEAGRNCVYWHDGTNIHPLLTQDPAATLHAEAAAGPPATVTEPRPTEPPPQTSRPNAWHSPAPDQCDPEKHPDGKTVVGQITMSNRTEFCIILAKRLAEWRRGGATPSVIMIRIDDFGRIAGKYGERVGSLVLKATAQFLNAAIRDMDMVAHYDTATFAVLFPGTWLANVIGIAERLREAIARCCLPTDRGQLKFTVSIGGAKAMESDDSKRLLQRTEDALVAASEAGGNCSMFHNGAWSETVSAAMERVEE
ncbi:MAG: GGDEF domain-containing protein [Thermoguttaceae bacterium]|jgi:diguanylate cyclase|nr:GGDEF domain-containing protein [Thermoguttaceae bacterium]